MFVYFGFFFTFFPKIARRTEILDSDWKIEKSKFHLEFPTIRSEATGTTT